MLPLLDNAQPQRLCTDCNQRQKMSVAYRGNSLQGSKEFGCAEISGKEKVGSSQGQTCQNVTPRNLLSHLLPLRWQSF
jgi:hypothetical protein